MTQHNPHSYTSYPEREGYSLYKFNDVDNPILANKVHGIHGDDYVGRGYVTPEAQPGGPGTPLIDSIDQARGDLVTYYLLEEDSPDCGVGTLRVRGLGARGLKGSQFYRTGHEGLPPGFSLPIQKHIEYFGIQSVVELCALSGNSRLANLKLIRHLVHSSTSDQMWIAQFVEQAYHSLLMMFGGRVIKSIGEPVSLAVNNRDTQKLLDPDLKFRLTYIIPSQVMDNLEADGSSVRKRTLSFMKIQPVERG